MKHSAKDCEAAHRATLPQRGGQGEGQRGRQSGRRYEMPVLVFAVSLLLAACASPPPADTHVCTETPTGLAECHLIEPAP